MGSLSTIPASDLGAIVIKEVLKRANVDAGDVNEIILGQVLTAAQGQNPARQAAFKAGIPKEVPSYLVNMLCGSGLKAVGLGFQAIKCGDSKIVICGGQESMSKAPHAIHMRNGTKMGNSTMVDTMMSDGLTDAMNDVHMGITAENIAKEFEISREDQDAFAVASQNKAENAQKSGYFSDEIVAVSVPSRKETITFDKDEFPKHGTKVETVAKLKPCFIKDGTVTPANASGINDSAAALLLMSADELAKRSATPMAKIIGFAQVAVEPKIMGTGPITAVQEVVSYLFI